MRAHGFVAVVLITGVCDGTIFPPIQQQVEVGAESEVWGWVMDNDPAKNAARLHSDVLTHAGGDALSPQLSSGASSGRSHIILQIVIVACATLTAQRPREPPVSVVLRLNKVWRERVD